MYLLHLRELAATHGCAVHAYCLMTNHVHLLITPDTGNGLSALMQNLGQRYVQHFNRAYGRSGTLWEGRFRSCVAESAHYVLACHRYIELNPVRAGMVSHPGAHPWSSYRANAEGREDRLLTLHPEYLNLGRDCASRQQAYQDLIEDSLEPSLVESIREATNGGYPLGSDSFKTSIASSLGRKPERGRPGRPPNRNKGQNDSPEIGL